MFQPSKNAGVCNHWFVQVCGDCQGESVVFAIFWTIKSKIMKHASRLHKKHGPWLQDITGVYHGISKFTNANWGWSWMIYVWKNVSLDSWFLVSSLVALLGHSMNGSFLFFLCCIYIYILYTFFNAHLACFTSNWSIRIWRLWYAGWVELYSKCQQT